MVTAIVPVGPAPVYSTPIEATRAGGGTGVSVFAELDGLYGVRIITGPRSVPLRLELLDERIEDFEVAAYTTEGLFRDPARRSADAGAGRHR